MSKVKLPTLFICCVVLLSCFSGCQDVGSHPKNLNGETLAKTYCAACHAYPEPTLLNRASWEDHMLPRMGHMLGIYDSLTREDLVRMDFAGDREAAKIIYPEQAALSHGEWDAIRAFYLAEAPEQVPTPEAKPIVIGDLPFEVIQPTLANRPPSTTMAKWGKEKDIYIGDAHSQSLIFLDDQLALIKAGRIKEGAVWIEEIEDDFWITVMGSFAPTDISSGMVIRLPREGSGRAEVIAEGLRRPVHCSYGDLNGDGHRDVVVSEFGKWSGRLSALINDGQGQYAYQVIQNQTGAIRSELRDVNDDGRLDIIALFAQGNEGIQLFTNQGDLNFERKTLISFSPSHGSSSFKMMDIDEDGDEDIIYTAGDNADFKPILKPYHGIYIYENLGGLNFELQVFEHMNGAYGAIPRDFDMDGDIDIAGISFFPDYTSGGKESFIYFENEGDMTFSRKTFEDNTMGRWIVMDDKDYDGDGDIDLLLGALAFEVVPPGNYVQRWMKEGLPFIVLENTTR